MGQAALDPHQVEIAQKIESPAYTPGRRDLDALIAGIVSGALPQGAATSALLRAGAAARSRVAERLALDGPGAAPGSERAGLVRLLFRLSDAEDAAQRAELLRLLDDPDLRVGRQAVIAAGKLTAHAAEVGEHLRALWPRRPDPADRRALAEALGKLGDSRAAELLRAARTALPKESPLRGSIERALLMIERSRTVPAQGSSAAPLLEAVLPADTRLSLRCRAGLAALLRDELCTRGLLPRETTLTLSEPEPGRAPSGELAQVSLRWSGPLAPLFSARTFCELALPIVSGPAPRDDDERIEAALAALAGPRVQELLQALGARPGEPLRCRIELQGSGPRRALVWRIAQALSVRCPLLLSDPKDSPWELRLAAAPGARLELELFPRKLPDPRFAYRSASVPASSQPTLAAALARLVDAGPEDTVWDPFVGAGAELIEVALLGRCHRLVGTDLDEAALAAARQNLAAAGVKAKLVQGDALSERGPIRDATRGVTCIVTNPPMGRRVQRGGVTDLLAAFVVRAAELLPRGGRLAWLDPQPRRHEPVLRAHGLRPLVLRNVDMNGFYAQLELWQKS